MQGRKGTRGRLRVRLSRGKEWIERLARFVAEERECCRFFAFELRFEPDLGSISFRMRGPEGTKEFLAGPFTEEFAGEHSLELD
jgi:hypothetical protein